MLSVFFRGLAFSVQFSRPPMKEDLTLSHKAALQFLTFLQVTSLQNTTLFQGNTLHTAGPYQEQQRVSSTPPTKQSDGRERLAFLISITERNQGPPCHAKKKHPLQQTPVSKHGRAYRFPGTQVDKTLLLGKKVWEVAGSNPGGGEFLFLGQAGEATHRTAKKKKITNFGNRTLDLGKFRAFHTLRAQRAAQQY